MLEKRRLTESFVIRGKIDSVSAVNTRLIKNHILSNFNRQILPMLSYMACLWGACSP